MKPEYPCVGLRLSITRSRGGPRKICASAVLADPGNAAATMRPQQTVDILELDMTGTS